MAAPRVLVLRAAGINCDVETAYAFELAGAKAQRLHINRLLERPDMLEQFQILAIPGGFSYGDDVSAGKILANQLSHHLAEPLGRFIEAGKLVIGICNGFQVLCKAGLLPNVDGTGKQTVTLALNDSARFEDRWVHLEVASDNCPWLQNLQRIYLPIAHGEGKFIARDEQHLQQLQQARQIALRYVDAAGRPGPYPVNPNGSQGDVAAICDPTGRVLGMMPHPERYTDPTHHPQWSRGQARCEPHGLQVIRNGVRYAR